MPEIFRFYGFKFFFYSLEHTPIHVHVEGKGGKAKFELKDGEFVLQSANNIKNSDLRHIVEVIDDNKENIIKMWKLYFKDNNGEN